MKSMARPNIVLLITDNQPVDLIGCMDRGACQTPTFDRIGHEGVVMENLRTTSPVCTPARASLFTGMQPQQAGLTRSHLSWKDQWGVEQEDETFACPPVTDHLRPLGYECLYAGKWHVGAQNVENSFDRVVAAGEGFEDYMAWCREQSIPNGFIFRDPERGKPFRFHDPPHMVQPHTAPLDIPADKEHNRWMLDRALELLETRDPTRPLFMVFSTYGPHPPLAIPEPYYSMVDPATIVEPDGWGIPADEPPFYRDCYYRRMFRHFGESFDDWRKIIAVTMGYATYIDALFREFVERLGNRLDLDDTLLLMLSDHGDMLGKRGLWRLFIPYEPSLRAPWLMRWPGVIRPGSRCRLDATMPDVAATVLAAAGVEIGPLALEGQDVLPYVTGQRPEPEARDCFSQFNMPPSWDQWFGVADWRCIVRRPWKLIVYTDGTEELFHLVDDPDERANRAEDPAARARRDQLREALIAWSTRTGDSFPYQGG